MANAELQRFHQLFAPFEYLSAVVAQELRAGARSVADRRQLERHVLDLYGRRGRVVTPSTQAWHDSGDLLAELARHEGLEVGRLSKAFGNDVLLALSCREEGHVLVTDNRRDLSALAAWHPSVSWIAGPHLGADPGGLVTTHVAYRTWIAS